MNRFDDIRPYNDSEINAAMNRIAADPLFPLLSSYVFPDRSTEDVMQLIKSISTIHDFQMKVMFAANKRIISNSITELSYSGLENIDPTVSHVFISNHRDIMLDASLLQSIFTDNGLETTEITFGANLMQGQLVIDVGKSNKMFRVERPGNNIREFFKASEHLSDYIRATITRKHNSIWIAQRNGRTKDGMDRTDQGLINMFRLSAPQDKAKSISELNIIPVAVSYEWEPCDFLKAEELHLRNQGPYVKKQGEDLGSIISGITERKGRVHIHVCKPISIEELRPYNCLNSSEFNKQIAALLDSRICPGYKLWPNNYIAHDILHATRQFSDHYTDAEESAFLAHFDRLQQIHPDFGEVRHILLGIYANPVDSMSYFNRLS